MNREQVHSGLVVKLLTNYAPVPAGTWSEYRFIQLFDSAYSRGGSLNVV